MQLQNGCGHYKMGINRQEHTSHQRGYIIQMQISTRRCKYQ